MQNIGWLVICVGGIYASFISWALLFERISTRGYGPDESEFFKAPLLINGVQSLFACLVGSVYLSLKTKKFQTPLSFLGNPEILKSFATIAVTQTISSPIAYCSLSHVSYLTYLLAKSCKLIPVMLVHKLIYSRSFPLFKYFVAFLVTVGVSVFTLGNGKAKPGSNDGNTLLGMAFLVISLFMDGLTNSTQDNMFKKKLGVTGAHLMSGLNFLACGLSLVYVILFTTELQDSARFIVNYPQVLHDILVFAVLGSIGQIFIFITLEKFDSIVLVTVTVTRKMLSMLFSVFLFGHDLSLLQWVGVACVFGGISAEAIVGLKSQPKTKKQ
ncbi:unnamed protein product [Kuraishia capsulata CBS 1993]|uniref:UDP-galactose transporter homolog 1 n=1 Tax=Kuraishia capsulata CBS 1993 TaxID=1382522 RepID=W6MKI3_9ASCO|nr:uncharacterized protein KUCA_T00002996001 [Kuraishia capsulata CBS 1993]CDK27019.1 unnamed protein product [Kuraishia capsulata CBS 1993]